MGTGSGLIRRRPSAAAVDRITTGSRVVCRRPAVVPPQRWPVALPRPRLVDAPADWRL